MLGQHSTARIQFTLRRLFALISVIAACAAVFRVTGWVETAGVAVAISLAAACWLLPKFRWHRVARVGLAVFAAVALWMAAIDYVTYRKGCIHCNSHAIHGDYRVFQQPIWGWHDKDHFPYYRLIAEDLDAPCPHEYERIERMRLWGLLLWTGQCPLCCIDFGDWYKGSLRDRVKMMGKKDPQLAATFRDEVCLRHNLAYAKKFIGDLEAADAKDKSN
jgi:hypothetical protein